jgi:hypothetical protein
LVERLPELQLSFDDVNLKPKILRRAMRNLLMLIVLVALAAIVSNSSKTPAPNEVPNVVVDPAEEKQKQKFAHRSSVARQLVAR